MNKKEILQFIEPMMDKLEYCIEFTEIRKTYDLVEIYLYKHANVMDYANQKEI